MFGVSNIAQNQLVIPPVLTGTNISLTLDEATHEFYPGVVTNTIGANGDLLGQQLLFIKIHYIIF